MTCVLLRNLAVREYRCINKKPEIERSFSQVANTHRQHTARPLTEPDVTATNPQIIGEVLRPSS
eukprot:scaffold14455_cov96-Skeletonema_dohrnii-CCMP3373.AAC.2